MLQKVVNHRPSLVVLAREVREGGELRIDEMEFKPGAQNVDSERLALFGGASARFFRTGMLTLEAVQDATQDALPQHGGDLSKLKMKAALRTIAQCKDPRQLRVWINQDGRSEVREALIKRHEELAAEVEGGSGGDAAE